MLVIAQHSTVAQHCTAQAVAAWIDESGVENTILWLSLQVQSEQILSRATAFFGQSGAHAPMSRLFHLPVKVSL